MNFNLSQIKWKHITALKVTDKSNEQVAMILFIVVKGLGLGYSDFIKQNKITIRMIGLFPYV